MQLRDYIFQSGITVAEFGRRLEYHPTYMQMIARGDRKPSKRLVTAIEKETGGRVTKKDWPVKGLRITRKNKNTPSDEKKHPQENQKAQAKKKIRAPLVANFPT